MSEIQLVAPNIVVYKGQRKKLAPYGKSSDGFWTKQDMLELARAKKLVVTSTMTRKDLAAELICTLFTSLHVAGSDIKLDEDYRIWRADILHKPWKVLGTNFDYQREFTSKVTSYIAFSLWMYGVVANDLPSPYYDFNQDEENPFEEENPFGVKEEENPDNYWWNGSKAHQLLLSINQTHKFISLDSQTLDTQDDPEFCRSKITKEPVGQGDRFRSYICGIMTEYNAEFVVNQMNKKGFVAYSSRMNPAPANTKNTIVDSSLRPRFVDYLDEDEYPFFHSRLVNDLKQFCVYVNIFDPVNYRPAEEDDGLFSTLLCVLKENCTDE